MKNEEYWEVYGWVHRGKQRRTVILALGDAPVTAEEFRKELNKSLPEGQRLSLREVSRHFTSFREQGLMKCLTPGVPYGVLYQVTALGKKVQKGLKKKILKNDS